MWLYTSVSLNWNETTYGAKTYTVKINGTTSSTETITLTDPNTPTTPSYEFHLSNGSLSTTFTWDGTDATWPQPSGTGNLTAGGNTATWQTQDFASGYGGGASPGQFNPGILGVANYGPYDIQQNETHDSTYHIVFTNNIWSITHGGFTWKITLTDPNASTPSVPDIQPIVNTGGSWNGVHSWASPTTETINGSVEYHYKLSFDTNSRIAYRTIDKTWYDADISSQPTALSSDAFSTQSSALVNPQYVWIGDTSSTNTDFYVSFDNPYYEAPTTTIQSVSINNGAWTDHTFTPDDSAVSGKYAWDLQHDAGSGFYKIGDLHSLEYIPGYGWFVINVNGDGFGDVSPTSSTSGTYLDANGTSQSFSSNFASSSNGVLTIAHGGGTITLNEADFFTDGVLPTPTFRTGTSQGFAFTSGVWKDQSYTAVLDDEANSSSGKLVNGVRQWEWDMPDIGGGRLYSGENNWIYFVPGTAEDNGTWFHGSTSTGGPAGTRNGREIDFGVSATFDETSAFVDGLVPYGDIP